MLRVLIYILKYNSLNIFNIIKNINFYKID